MTNVVYLSERVSGCERWHSDAELDFWGDVYLAGGIKERLGIAFEDFLRSPWTHLAACGRADTPGLLACGFRPLLPAQERVIADLHAMWVRQGLMDPREAMGAGGEKEGKRGSISGIASALSR